MPLQQGVTKNHNYLSLRCIYCAPSTVPKSLLAYLSPCEVDMTHPSCLVSDLRLEG